MNTSTRLLGMVLIVCLMTVGAGLGSGSSTVQGQPIGQKAFVPLDQESEAASEAINTTEFNMAKESLASRGLRLDLAEAVIAKDGGFPSLLIPVKGRKTSLLDSIAIPEDVSASSETASYNARYAPGNIRNNSRWMIYTAHPDFHSVFYVEAVSFHGTTQPVIVLTGPGDGKIIFNHEEGFAYTIAPREGVATNSIQPQASFSFKKYWDCLRRAFGLSSSYTSALRRICDLTDKMQALVAISGCVGVSLGCLFTLTQFLACTTREVVACYNQAR